MRRFRFIGVGIAVLAVLAMTVVSSASAAVTFLLAEWLENGIGITETMLAEATGMLLLANLNAPIIKTEAAVECSGIGVGSIGVNGAGDATEGLSLSGALISATPLSGTSLSCTDEHDCESSKLWAVNLPWLGILELWEEGTESGFVVLGLPHTGGGNPGWYIECTLLGVKASEECTAAESAAEARNATGGVEIVDSEEFTLLMEDKLGRCSGNNEETAVLAGSGLLATSLAGPLTVSE